MATLNLTDAVTLDNVLDEAGRLNLDADQTLDLLYGALGLARITQRVFKYTEPFSQTAPACTSSFVRSFVHTDWIDGESVVQAEQNSLEEGFNVRFHKIENDFDALARDVAQAFVCLGEQRASLAKRFDEIKAEINRINADIHECCQKQPSTGGTIFVPPVVVDGTRFPGGTGPIGPSGPIVNPSDPSGPLINPGTIGGTTFGGNTPWGPNVDPVQNYLDQIKGMRSFTGIGTQIVRSTADPTRAVVAGLQAKLLEETEFNGQQVEVWSTSAGLILTPLAARPAVDVGTRKGWTNPRIEATSRFAKWAVANAQDVSTAFNREEFQLKAFLEKFGSEKVEGGITITALLGDLPTGTTAKSPLDFVAVLAEANGKAIAREGFATETVIGSIGLDQKAEELTKTAPTTVKSIPSKAAKGLEQIGIKNLEGLRKAVPDKVSSKLAEIGVEAKAEEIAGWQAIAGTLIAVDKAARGTI